VGQPGATRARSSRADETQIELELDVEQRSRAVIERKAEDLDGVTRGMLR
jgi:hypothetical protein